MNAKKEKMSLLKTVAEGFEKLDQMIEDAKRLMAGDVVEETDDEYIIKVNLPLNIKKEDINAYIEKGTIKVDIPVENIPYFFPYFLPRICNLWGVSVPFGADADTVTATFENGVLTVAFKKTASARWHKITVK